MKRARPNESFSGGRPVKQRRDDLKSVSYASSERCSQFAVSIKRDLDSSNTDENEEISGFDANSTANHHLKQEVECYDETVPQTIARGSGNSSKDVDCSDDDEAYNQEIDDDDDDEDYRCSEDEDADWVEDDADEEDEDEEYDEEEEEEDDEEEEEEDEEEDEDDREAEEGEDDDDEGEEDEEEEIEEHQSMTEDSRDGEIPQALNPGNAKDNKKPKRVSFEVAERVLSDTECISGSLSGKDNVSSKGISKSSSAETSSAKHDKSDEAKSSLNEDIDDGASGDDSEDESKLHSYSLMGAPFMDEMIDTKLQEAAKCRNLSVHNVKRLLKEVLTDPDVVTLFRQYLVGGHDTDRDVIYEPKLTRSSLRKAEEAGCLPSLLGGQSIGTIACRSEPTILDVQFPDDEEEDEDYQPPNKGTPEDEEEDEEEDEGANNTSVDDLSYFSATSVEEKTSEVPLESDQSSTPAVPGWGLPLTACTRSKMPLTDKSMKELEASWQPPDISPDMYESAIDRDSDPEYIEFLQSIFGPDPSPANHNQSLQQSAEAKPESIGSRTYIYPTDMPPESLGDMPDSSMMLGRQEEDDPEFNVMAEPDELYRDDFLEDFRDDKTVRVPKRELRELFDDLYDIVTTEDGDSRDSALPTSTVKSKKRVENDVDIDYTPRHQTFNTAPPMPLKLPRGADEDIPCADLLRISTRRVRLLNDSEREQLNFQMRLHVQLIAQFYFMCVGQPVLENIMTQQINFLEELDSFRQSSKTSLQWSAYNVSNLDPAIQVVREFDGVPGLEERTETRELLNHTISTLVMPRCLAHMILQSSAFPFAQILPHGLAVLEHPKKNKVEYRSTPWSTAEENLLALGLQQFAHCGKNALQLIHTYMLPNRTVQQMRMHKTLLIKRCNIPHPLLRILVNRPIFKHNAETARIQAMRIPMPTSLDNLATNEDGCLWNRPSRWPDLPPIFLMMLRHVSKEHMLKTVPNTNTKLYHLPYESSSYFFYQSIVRRSRLYLRTDHMDIKWKNENPIDAKLLMSYGPTVNNLRSFTAELRRIEREKRKRKFTQKAIAPNPEKSAPAQPPNVIYLGVIQIVQPPPADTPVSTPSTPIVETVSLRVDPPTKEDPPDTASSESPVANEAVTKTSDAKTENPPTTSSAALVQTPQTVLVGTPTLVPSSTASVEVLEMPPGVTIKELPASTPNTTPCQAPQTVLVGTPTMVPSSTASVEVLEMPPGVTIKELPASTPNTTPCQAPQTVLVSTPTLVPSSTANVEVLEMPSLTPNTALIRAPQTVIVSDGSSLIPVSAANVEVLEMPSLTPNTALIQAPQTVILGDGLSSSVSSDVLEIPNATAVQGPQAIVGDSSFHVPSAISDAVVMEVEDGTSMELKLPDGLASLPDSSSLGPVTQITPGSGEQPQTEDSLDRVNTDNSLLSPVFYSPLGGRIEKNVVSPGKDLVAVDLDTPQYSDLFEMSPNKSWSGGTWNPDDGFPPSPKFTDDSSPEKEFGLRDVFEESGMERQSSRVGVKLCRRPVSPIVIQEAETSSSRLRDFRETGAVSNSATPDSAPDTAAPTTAAGNEAGPFEIIDLDPEGAEEMTLVPVAIPVYSLPWSFLPKAVLEDLKNEYDRTRALTIIQKVREQYELEEQNKKILELISSPEKKDKRPGRTRRGRQRSRSTDVSVALQTQIDINMSRHRPIRPASTPRSAAFRQSATGESRGQLKTKAAYQQKMKATRATENNAFVIAMSKIRAQRLLSRSRRILSRRRRGSGAPQANCSSTVQNAEVVDPKLETTSNDNGVEGKPGVKKTRRSSVWKIGDLPNPKQPFELEKTKFFEVYFGDSSRGQRGGTTRRRRFAENLDQLMYDDKTCPPINTDEKDLHFANAFLNTLKAYLPEASYWEVINRLSSFQLLTEDEVKTEVGEEETAPQDELAFNIYRSVAEMVEDPELLELLTGFLTEHQASALHVHETWRDVTEVRDFVDKVRTQIPPEVRKKFWWQCGKLATTMAPLSATPQTMASASTSTPPSSTSSPSSSPITSTASSPVASRVFETFARALRHKPYLLTELMRLSPYHKPPGSLKTTVRDFEVIRLGDDPAADASSEDFFEEVTVFSHEDRANCPCPCHAGRTARTRHCPDCGLRVLGGQLMWDNANVVVHFPRPPEATVSLGESVSSKSHSPRRKTPNNGDLLSYVCTAVGRDRASLRQMALRSWSEQCRQRRNSDPPPDVGTVKKEQEVVKPQEKAAEAQEKAAEAQEKAAEAQEKAAETQEKAAEAQEKAAETQEKAAETQEKATEAQEKAAEIQEKAAETQEKAAETQEKAAETQEKAAETQEKAAETQEKAAEAQEKAFETPEANKGEEASRDQDKMPENEEKAAPVMEEVSKDQVGHDGEEAIANKETEGEASTSNQQIAVGAANSEEISNQGQGEQAKAGNDDVVIVKVEPVDEETREWCMAEDAELLTYLQTKGISEAVYEELTINSCHLKGRTVTELRRRFDYLMTEYQRTHGNTDGEAPWNQWEDRILLQYCQTNGTTSSAFEAISRKLDNQRTPENLERRYDALMRIFNESSQ